jgi:hypothetical protein
MGAGRVSFEEGVDLGDACLVGVGVEQIGRGGEREEFLVGFFVGLLAVDGGDVGFRDALLVLDAFGDLVFEVVMMCLFL